MCCTRSHDQHCFLQLSHSPCHLQQDMCSHHLQVSIPAFPATKSERAFLSCLLSSSSPAQSPPTCMLLPFISFSLYSLLYHGNYCTSISPVLLSITFVSLFLIPHSTQSLLSLIHMQTCLASQAMTVPSSARLTMRGGTSRSQSTLDPPRHTQLVILALWPRSVVTCGQSRRTRQMRRGEWEDKKRKWEGQKHKFIL